MTLANARPDRMADECADNVARYQELGQEAGAGGLAASDGKVRSVVTPSIFTHRSMW
ncbi:MAG TPA: hypothetical protein VD789_12460 [Thermomicrobiales bacterium]|nr:hypothetical protein [Thermomicrobiales bacterium]